MSEVAGVKVTLPDGYVVARLPLVRVDGDWHLIFLGRGPRVLTREETSSRRGRGLSLSARVRVEGLDGDFERLSSGGHGSAGREQYHVAFSSSGSTVRVVYTTPGEAEHREELSLTGDAHLDLDGAR